MRKILVSLSAVALAFIVLTSPAIAQKGGRSSSSSSSSSSRSSYSSGSRSFTPSHSAPSHAPAAPRVSAPKPSSGYSSGSKTFTPNSLTSSPQPSKSSLDSGASRSSKVVQSTAAYQASKPVPKPVQERIAATSARATQPRESRERVVYRNAPTTVIYHDTFHPGLDSYLLSQSANTMAMFLYSHRAEMDDARYRDLLARNADARVRLAELESRHVAIDPTYSPPGLDFDLMYQPPVPHRSGFVVFLRVVGIILVIAVVIGLGIFFFANIEA